MTAELWNRFADIAAARAQDPAVMVGDSVLSFSALQSEAELLAARLEVAPGARVVICAQNAPQVIAAVAAVWRAGAIPVMVHAEAPERHLVHAVLVTEPDLVLGDRTPDEPLAATFHLIDQEATTGELPPPAAQTCSQEPGSIVFTSGSTGLPKGVTQSCANLRDGAARIAAHLGYLPDDRILAPVPFAFDYGWGQLLSLLLEGIALVLPVPRNGFGICAALDTHAPTVFAGVPAVFADLLAGLAPVANAQRDTVRLVTNTGSKIPVQVYERLLENFPHAALSLNYGLTETYRTASLPMEMTRSNPFSVGRAVPGVEIDVVRPDGSRASPDEEGEIIHRGAGTFLGYWNDPDATARTLRPDPLGDRGASPVVFTGDLGRIDADGLLYVHGRRDRQMKSMGVRVSPDEVEALLAESGLLSEAAVVSEPHDTLGEMIVAVVAPTTDAGTDQKALLKSLKAHARHTMSPYMQPRRYIVLPTLPRTPSAKIDYPALRSILDGSE